MQPDVDRERLAAFFDHSPDAIVVVDADGIIVRANDRVEDMFGYEPDEIEGQPVETLVPTSVRDDHPDLRDRYMADPSTRPMGAGLELVGERKDGTTFPVDISLSPIETDGGLEVIASVRDITERERHRRKYRTLMETAPDAMFVADAETGTLLEVNERATELMGAEESALVGKDHTSLHPPEDRERYRDLFRKHARGETGMVSRYPDDEDIIVETASGDRIPVEISGQPVELDGETVVIGVFRDISDRREYERQLQEEYDRLETLAGVLSHDLRNPLNVAEAYVDLAREHGDLDRLDHVETAHDRMGQIIEDALTLIREGSDVEAVEPLDFESIVSECWQHVRTPDATLQVETGGLIYADSRRIRHVFENLFRNAIDQGGETVTVRVGVTPEGFYVADDGPGVPEGRRDAVFDAGWTTETDGTGLGLSIVADIATAHGWKVSISESETGGARFDVTGARTAVYDDAFVTEDDDLSP